MVAMVGGRVSTSAGAWHPLPGIFVVAIAGKAKVGRGDTPGSAALPVGRAEEDVAEVIVKVGSGRQKWQAER